MEIEDITDTQVIAEILEIGYSRYINISTEIWLYLSMSEDITKYV